MLKISSFCYLLIGAIVKTLLGSLDKSPLPTPLYPTVPRPLPRPCPCPWPTQEGTPCSCPIWTCPTCSGGLGCTRQGGRKATWPPLDATTWVSDIATKCSLSTIVSNSRLMNGFHDDLNFPEHTMLAFIALVSTKYL